MFGGGAISLLDSNLIIHGGVLFEGNSADTGGAIYAQRYFHHASVELRNVRFERNTALLNGRAVYADNTPISMTGTLQFVKNSAQRGGAMTFRSSSKLLLTEPLMTNFSENSATISGGVIFFL